MIALKEHRGRVLGRLWERILGTARRARVQIETLCRNRVSSRANNNDHFESKPEIGVLALYLSPRLRWLSQWLSRTTVDVTTRDVASRCG